MLWQIDNLKNNEMMSQIMVSKCVKFNPFAVFEVRNIRRDKTECYHNYNLRKARIKVLEKSYFQAFCVERRWIENYSYVN